MAAAAPFTILTICTGNIHRSPAAQFLLAASLDRSGDVMVHSAGTLARTGEAVAEPMGSFLRGEGIDTSGFVARFLTADLVRSADLVLGMTRGHRSHAVSLWPAATRTSFTLKEFARLSTLVPPEELAATASTPSAADRLAALTTLAPRYRTPATAADDDVVDPQRQSDAVAERALRDIVQAVETIVTAVRGRRGRHAG